MDLKPGQNDISRLSPGVYFVHARDEGGGMRDEPEHGRQLLAIRKVVITD